MLCELIHHTADAFCVLRAPFLKTLPWGACFLNVFLCYSIILTTFSQKLSILVGFSLFSLLSFVFLQRQCDRS